MAGTGLAAGRQPGGPEHKARARWLTAPAVFAQLLSLLSASSRAGVVDIHRLR